MGRHTPTCRPPVTDSDDTQASDTDSAPAGAGHHEPVPGAEGWELLSEERLRWLDGLEWAAVGRCPYSTIKTPKGAKAQFQETQGPVRTCFNKGQDDRAWKLHFWYLWVLFAPTQKGANAMSVTQLVKHRCSALLRGEWAHLWEEAQAAPQMGATSAASEPGQGDEESARQRRIDKRARMFARQGDLSKAMSVFDSDAVLDPTEPDIWQQLEQLHDPDTEIEPLPDKPEGLHTDPQYEYKLGTVGVPTADGGRAEIPT